ncbi:hypothetical protein K7472_16065 [Streptomyces sp. PTM05]|uniref:DUF4232 domain-containing protein n=1 Tax=Streptantibioticus parmotrematis TaxID=2873249 RepID=A0ABS7QT50_9ACTN|nr:hypothetical protein [Streptantibioticus parmotrematis]MBY8886371.1 hypothetical protein [Streptantibioticus parmotrematis]
MRCTRSSATIVTAAALALAMGSSAARADDAGVAKSLTTKAAGEVCTATVQSPHRSSGAKDGRILFKTRVTCEGDIPAVTVNIRGSLEEGPLVGPKRIMTTSDQSQVIKTGGTATFYTPLANGKQVKAAGTYTGFITGEITAPAPGNIGTAQSKTVVIK